MPREGAIEVEGVVVEVLPNKMYRVELANGHRMLAYITGKASLRLSPLMPGGRVRLEVSPCDVSSGRLVVERQT